MSSHSNVSPPIPPPRKGSEDHEFEWLLCLANTFHACHCRESVQFEESQQLFRAATAAGKVQA
jgi:hypothetical protein